MSETKFGLDDLEIGDDLDVSLDNETYKDQQRNTPVPAGNYLVRALDIKGAVYRGGDNKGQPVLRDGKYPILEIPMVEIIDGLGDGVTRKVGVFLEVGTKPYDRDGEAVTQVGDLARAFGFPNYSSFGELRSLLKEAVQLSTPFAAVINWESAFDKEFVEAAMQQLGLAGRSRDSYTAEEKKLANLVQYRYSKVQGQKNFPTRANGTHIPSITRGNVEIAGPNGNVVIEVPTRTLEARNVIPTFFNNISFIPKGDVDSGRVNFGPFKVKAAVAA
jgi:hypothetical protein